MSNSLASFNYFNDHLENVNIITTKPCQKWDHVQVIACVETLPLWCHINECKGCVLLIAINTIICTSYSWWIWWCLKTHSLYINDNILNLPSVGHKISIWGKVPSCNVDVPSLDFGDCHRGFWGLLVRTRMIMLLLAMAIWMCNNWWYCWTSEPGK